MIDPENEVFDIIDTELKTSFKTIYTGSDYANAPGKFPYVSITMSDDHTDQARQSSSEEEQTAICQFLINIYTASTARKSEAKKIAQVIDKLLLSMNFTRTAYTFVPNLQNASIYRLVLTYEVKTDGKGFYRR